MNSAAKRQENISERVAFLSKTPMFSKLADKSLLLIANEASPRSFQKGEILYEKDNLLDDGDFMYIYAILQGEVRFEKGLPKKEGNVFGDLEVLADEPRIETVTVDSDVLECLVIEKSSFFRLIKSDTHIGNRMIDYLIDQIQKIENELYQAQNPDKMLEEISVTLKEETSTLLKGIEEKLSKLLEQRNT